MNKKPIYKTTAGEQAIMAVYEEILAEWPESTESLEVGTRHGRTHVLAHGRRDASPLVLLHGAGSNALAWGADMPEFARDFRVYAVETPGEPGRSCHERFSWQGNAVVDWLGDVLDALGLGQTLLAGISQGGYIALRFAVARPERVRALVLLAPGGVVPARLGFVMRGITCSMLGRRGSAALVRSIMGDDGVPQVAIDYMTLIFTHFRSRMDPQPLLTDGQLRGLSMPVLLIAGGRDSIFDGEKIVERVKRLIDKAEIRLLPTTGHALIHVASLASPFFLSATPAPAD